MTIAQTALLAPSSGERRPWPVRLYVALEWFRRRISHAGVTLAQQCAHLVMAMYQGLWLGLLDRDALTAITRIAYDEARAGERWDEVSYVDSGLHGWEKDFVARLPRDARVLIGCAGAGREAFALARQGFVVAAFDCSETLIDSARARNAADGAGVRLVKSAPDEAPELGTFDAAIVGWGGYIHIIGRERRIAFLRGIRRQLVTGAPLLVSFLTRPQTSRRFKIATALADFVRRLRSREPIELGDELTHVGTFAHCFTRDEIVAELEAAGFRFDWFGAKDVGDVKDGYVVGLASPGSARMIPARLYFEIERRREAIGAALKPLTGQFVADLAHALYKGVWLGALDDDQLAAITQIYYAERGPEWRNDRWTELGLKPWEQEAIDRHFVGRHSLLVGCAGAGREAFALARRGFTVSAFDCSPTLVQSAREYAVRSGLAVNYALSAPDRVPDLGLHDGAIVGWGGYMHVIGAERRIAFLRRFRAQVEAGSPLLVSFYVRDEKNAVLATTAAIGSLVRRARGKKPLELGDELRPRFFRRTFTRADLEHELGDAGFQLGEFSREHEYAIGVAL